MSSTPHPSEPDHDAQPIVLPLSKRTRSGTLYLRPLEVEHQIESVVGLDCNSLLRRVRIRDPETAGYLKPETLAYLLRRAHMDGTDDVANTVAAELLERFYEWVYGAFRANGLRKEAALEAYQGFIADVVMEITDPSGAGDFFQVRFGRVFKLRLLTAINRTRRESRRDRLHDSLSDPLGGESDAAGVESGGTLGDTLASAETLTPIDHIALHDALNAITNAKHRAAFVLHWCEGWPVEAINPEEPCLSRHFKTTDRTIRNWLTRARAQIAAWSQEENTV